MTVKILLPAYGKHGSSIIAANRQLRVIDKPKHICHGFANGCNCGCSPRRVGAEPAKAKLCACDHPFSFVEGDCANCGRAIPGERPARKAA